MRKKWLATLLIVIHSPLWAVQVSSLYQVELPVATQQEDTRGEAVREGFRQVLVKLTGNPEVDKNPLIKSNIRRAEYYVQDYSYPQPSSESSTYLLRIRFSKVDTNRLLKKSGVVFWGDKRPLILVWLLVDDTVSTDVISNEESSELIEDLKLQGRKFGLPLIFPTMDVEDMNVVSSEDVGRMNLSILKSAGHRYAPDALLVGLMVKDKNSDTWMSRWKLVLKDNEWDYKETSDDPDTIFDTVLFQVGKTLSNQSIG